MHILFAEDEDDEEDEDENYEGDEDEYDEDEYDEDEYMMNMMNMIKIMKNENDKLSSDKS